MGLSFQMLKGCVDKYFSLRVFLCYVINKKAIQLCTLCSIELLVIIHKLNNAYTLLLSEVDMLM